MKSLARWAGMRSGVGVRWGRARGPHKNVPPYLGIGEDFVERSRDRVLFQNVLDNIKAWFNDASIEEDIDMMLRAIVARRGCTMRYL
jgi:hypothetical protein